MPFTPEQTKELQAPLSPSKVKRNPKGFDYVEGWHAIAEANRIFGHDSWDRITEVTQLGQPEMVGDKWRIRFMGKVTIRVYADGVTLRDGIGFGSGIAKDQGDAFEGAIKEAETDAMKRALMTFGNPFGLALYDKDKANVGDAPVPERDTTEAFVTACKVLEGITHGPIFKATWEARKDGWKKELSIADYAALVGKMKALCGKFAPATEEEANTFRDRSNGRDPRNDRDVPAEQVFS